MTKTDGGPAFPVKGATMSHDERERIAEALKEVQKRLWREQAISVDDDSVLRAATALFRSKPVGEPMCRVCQQATMETQYVCELCGHREPAPPNTPRP